MAATTLQKQLEEALIRDDPACAELAEALPIEALVPLLAKYAKPVHPYGTRERVLECLERRDEWEAVELLATFLADTSRALECEHNAQHDLRSHAASLLASKDCTRIANEIVEVLMHDLSRLLQVVPVVLSTSRGGGPTWRVALEGLRDDLGTLVRLTEDALTRVETAATVDEGAHDAEEATVSAPDAQGSLE